MLEAMQVLNIEFILLWCTYLAIMFTNLEAGIAIGFVLATMYFAFSYARVSSPLLRDLLIKMQLLPLCKARRYGKSKEL